MRIITTRRISQIFFVCLFFWFCGVSSLGRQWWQLRGWPINFFLELDPLAGLGMALTTGTLYKGMVWGLVTLVVTFFLGRVFCGWVCPFGAIHQFLGYIARIKQKAPEKVRQNRYHSGQRVKYWILMVMLGAIVYDLVLRLLGISSHRMLSTLTIGLLDPMPLLYRSINLIILPLIDGGGRWFSSSLRWYEGGFSIGLVFFPALLLNIKRPRFFCRYVCPLGALLGIFSRWPLFRIYKSDAACKTCPSCERHCEGACQPSENLRLSECVVCLNCREDCRGESIHYGLQPSATGEITVPDIRRREVVLSMVSGVAGMAAFGMEGRQGFNWPAHLVRPPGAVAETDFLARCIRCGQCMRICPTNVIQPAIGQAGWEALWTPILNFRIGTSGCQHSCIACGHVCPTAAIRPLSRDERMGLDDFASPGPIRIGTAFVDRGRCLPWAMDTPCIVCQENCPVSPKAIFTREVLNPIRMDRPLTVMSAEAEQVKLSGAVLPPGRYATGDYYCRIVGDPPAVWRDGQKPKRIIRQNEQSIFIPADDPFDPAPRTGDRVEILIRLQQPFVSPEHCIGCGICEHECPVSGKRAIRITADNESRNAEHSFLLS